MKVVLCLSNQEQIDWYKQLEEETKGMPNAKNHVIGRFFSEYVGPIVLVFIILILIGLSSYISFWLWVFLYVGFPIGLWIFIWIIARDEDKNGL